MSDYNTSSPRGSKLLYCECTTYAGNGVSLFVNDAQVSSTPNQCTTELFINSYCNVAIAKCPG